jgi:magnesium transporter
MSSEPDPRSVIQQLTAVGSDIARLPGRALRIPARAIGLGASVPRRRIGAPPGSLPEIPDHERAPAHISVVRYDAETFEERHGLTLGDAESLRKATGVSWIDVVGASDPEAIRAIGDAFGVHPLVQEDLAHPHQRPKLEYFRRDEDHDDQIFLIARVLHTPADSAGEAFVEQVGLLLGPGYLLTFRPSDSGIFQPIVERIRQNGGRVRRAGADYLAYALIDVIVDHYFVGLEEIGEQIERLEEDIMAAPQRGQQEQIRALRRTMLFLRRAVWPMREVLAALMRDESGLVDDQTKIYLRDAYDHAVQVVDVIESFREVIASLSDLYLSSLSHRLNEVMKVLTVVGTIFIPLSFLTGIYGMNFEYMPELGFRYGYFVFLGAVTSLLVGSLLYFRHRGWI